MNLQDLISRVGLEKVGFLTLTFAENVVSRKEAQRRFNSFATNFLRAHCPEYVCAVERQKRGAIHFHLVCAFRYDIRTGFDFEACSAANVWKKAGDLAAHRRLQSAYFASANDNLRAWWALVREAAPKYGFGRCETLPILSNSAGVARYVGSYVGTEYQMRELRDKGMRTLRYRLEHRAASVRWAWAEGTGRSWRRGCAVLASILGCDDLTEALGKRWAWGWRESVGLFGRHWEACSVVVAELSDHWSREERITRAAALADTLKRWEAEHPEASVC